MISPNDSESETICCDSVISSDESIHQFDIDFNDDSDDESIDNSCDESSDEFSD